MWFWSRRCPQFVALSRPPLSASPEILRLHSILITRINQPHDQPGGTSARSRLRNQEFARRDVNQFRYMIGNTNISKKLSVEKHLNHRKNIQTCPIFAPFQTLQLVTLFRAPSWSWKTKALIFNEGASIFQTQCDSCTAQPKKKHWNQTSHYGGPDIPSAWRFRTSESWSLFPFNAWSRSVLGNC